MSETMNAGKRRAAVPVDSGEGSGGRHRLGPTPPPAPEAHADSADHEGRARSRWFRRG